MGYKWSRNKMKKLLLTLTMSLLYVAAYCSTTATIDGIRYTLNNDGTASVAQQSRAFSGSADIPSTVNHNGKTYKVTSIGNGAFQGCRGLTSVTIGNSLMSIDQFAFEYCTGLTSITIPESVTSIGAAAFKGCSMLESIILPADLERIDSEVFEDCLNLKTITIPQSVKYMGEYVFRGCSAQIIMLPTTPPKLNTSGSNAYHEHAAIGSGDYIISCDAISAYYKNSDWRTAISYDYDVFSFVFCETAVLVSITDNFSGSADIPSTVNHNGMTYTVTSIGDQAFSGCTGLTSVTIPESVTSIGDQAFSGCTGLNSIVVAPNNTKYDSRDNCNAIIETATNTLLAGCQNTVIPNSIASIGSSAFYGCTGLTSVTIPESVTSIGGQAFFGCQAFSGCTGLNSIVVAPNNTKYDSRDNCNAIIETATNTLLAGCQNTVIPNSVTCIGSSAFNGCTGLTSIEIPNSVTSIGWSAFSGCTGLTSVTIPNSVTSIGFHAFFDIPYIVYAGSASGSPWGAKVKYAVQDGFLLYRDIEKTILSKCLPEAIGTITIPNSVTSIGSSAFSGCTGLTSVTIGESVTSIGDQAFSGCIGLKSVVWNAKNCEPVPFGPFVNSPITSFVFGNEVEHIPAFLCYDLNGLTAIDIPNSATSIGDDAFSGCTGLTSATIGESVTTIGNNAFSGCNAITDVVWNMKSCPDYASSSDAPFYDSRASVQTFTFGNAVENIPAYLCYEMRGLTDINVPKSVKTIGVHAFDGCNELVNLTLGNGLQDIADYAFAGCKRLDQIKVYAERTIDLTQYSFDNVGVKSLLPVYVPETRLNTYKRDIYWSQFNLQVMSAESTVTTDVSVTPHYTTVDVVWPSVTDAATYELTITNGGVTVCTLVFNAQGQLTSIAFHAPAAERQNAVASQQGFKFTVTGLDDGSAYNLTITAKNANGSVIKTFSKNFSTGYTALQNVDADNASLKLRKVIENGRVVILLPDGRKYDTNGQLIR